MEHNDTVISMARRIHAFFQREDYGRGDLYYLPWNKLSETEKSFWLECSYYALGEVNDNVSARNAHSAR